MLEARFYRGQAHVLTFWWFPNLVEHRNVVAVGCSWAVGARLSSKQSLGTVVPLDKPSSEPPVRI